MFFYLHGIENQFPMTTHILSKRHAVIATTSNISGCERRTNASKIMIFVHLRSCTTVSDNKWRTRSNNPRTIFTIKDVVLESFRKRVPKSCCSHLGLKFSTLYI